MPECTELDPCYVVAALSPGDLAGIAAPLILIVLLLVALLVRGLK